jgi:hypothetical protein
MPSIYDQCPAWDGNPKTLPEYVKCKIEPFHLEDLVLKYNVWVHESGTIKEVLPKDLHKHGERPESVIGVVINEDLYEFIVAHACAKPILFGKKDSPKELDREEWRMEFKTDALKLHFMKPYYHYHDEHHPHHEEEPHHPHHEEEPHHPHH